MKNNNAYKTHFSGEGVRCDSPRPQDGGADMFAILEKMKQFIYDNFGENIILTVAVANNKNDSASVTFEDVNSEKVYNMQVSCSPVYKYGGIVDVE
jgi:hypothetical protein